MAIADISLVAMAIAGAWAIKILKDDYRRPVREISDINQYKVMSLLLCVHLFGMIGSFLLPENDTAVFAGWVGQVWVLRYVVAFFVAWLIESFWIAINVEHPERTTFVVLPASAYVLTGACLWLWMLRLDNQPEESIETAANGPVVFPDVFILMMITGLACAVGALVKSRPEATVDTEVSTRTVISAAMLCATASGVFGTTITAIAQYEPQSRSSVRSFWTERYVLAFVIAAYLSLIWWFQQSRGLLRRNDSAALRVNSSPEAAIFGAINSFFYLVSYATLPIVSDEPAEMKMTPKDSNHMDDTHRVVVHVGWALVGACILLLAACVVGRFVSSVTSGANEAAENREAAPGTQGSGYGTMAPADGNTARRRDSADLEGRLSEDATEMSWAQVLARAESA